MGPNGRRVAERHLPLPCAGVEVDGGHGAVRRLDQRQLLRRRVIRRAGIRIGGDANAAVHEVGGVVEADRIVGHALLYPIHGRTVGALHEQRVRVRIVRRAAPPCSTDGSRHDDGALHRWRREDRAAAVLVEDRHGAAFQLRRKIEQVAEGHLLPRERPRECGHRLRRRRALAGHVALRHGALHDGPDGRARDAVEYVDPRRLRGHGHDVAWLSLPGNGGQHRRGGKIVVPQPVMHDLVMPHSAARARVERDDGLREQVVALPVAAIPVVGGRAHREKEQSSFGVKAHGGPDVGVSHIVVGAVLPRLPAKLAGIGNGLEAPHAAARAHVERLDVARRVLGIAQAITHPVAHDHDVAGDHGRRRVGVVELVHRSPQLTHEIDFAAIAERWNGLARAGVERHELPSRIDEHAPRVSVGPGGDATVHEARAVRRLATAPHFGIVLPQLPARARIEGGDGGVRRGDVHGIVNHHRRRLEQAGPRGLLIGSGGNGVLARLPRPRHAQLAHVGMSQ